jgi:hypothetical protein
MIDYLKEMLTSGNGRNAELLPDTIDTAALEDYADDTAAAKGGVLVGEFYRNGSALMMRVV